MGLLKKITLIKLFFLSLVVMVLLLPKFLNASEITAVNNPQGGSNAIMVSDIIHTQSTAFQTGKDYVFKLKDWLIDKLKWIRDEGIALAYKKALAYYLNKLAQDTATYIVTGNKGQKGMFWTEGWGPYLKNVSDNAMGHFLEELGKGGPIAFDLCDPGLPVTLSIGIGLMGDKAGKPECTFSEMKKRWEDELNRPDFMKRFLNIYNYQSNDFGIALALQSEMIEKEEFEVEAAKLNRQINQGWKDVTDPINQAIKTPGSVVREFTNKIVQESGENYFTYTGHIVADAIDVFTSTLVKKLMEKWLMKGLARKYDNSAYMGDWGGFNRSAAGGNMASESLSNYESDMSSGGGINAAEKDFESFITPNFSVKGDYSVLNELTTCMDPTNADTNECVITENFRQAIENRMTVGQATVLGYLNKNGVFGFKTDGLEPVYTEGIPYRSMIILRKYRIIPVGWELAAQYIMENQNELHRSFNLVDMIACFDATDRYLGYTEPWCAGLVDPSWVLKSPQNYCKREGAGPHIISQQVAGEKTASKFIVNRDTDYCADEQTCIKENKDGSCEIYGYCLEDKRKYNFGGESCEPKYNSCQTFRSSDGDTVSLLKNTLDYKNCDSENAGCELYKRSTNINDGAIYDLAANKIDWLNASSSIGLDDSIKECQESGEGCHQFIRTQPGLGTNLLSNASFENTQNPLSGWGSIGEVVSDSKEGFYALKLNEDINREIVINPSFGLKDGEIFDLNGSIFTLSLYAKDCNAGAKIDLNGESASMEAKDWQLIAVTKTFKEENSGNTIKISSTGVNSCVIDAVKLERTKPEAKGTPSMYVPYGSVGMVYEKLLPNYLYNKCYQDSNNDGFIEKIKNAPVECDKYARLCTSREVNCEMYKSKTDKMQIPAVVGANDYCPVECVGYDEFLQSETNFEDASQKFLIPSTAETCSLLSKGCDEFTNLDEVDDAENREYYIHLKRCVDASEPTCEPFFMWEGSDESGYQLKIHQLDTVNGGIATIDGVSGCSIDITAANYDQDCREYYDEEGKPYYELYYNTVSCTDQCHSYRRAAEDETRENCEKHKGEWRDNSVCIYRGIPGEGLSCDAEEAGCREYNGNAGANTRIVFQHSFENGTNQSWTDAVNSNASVIVGQHSLYIDGSASQVLGSDLIEGKSYILQFLASGPAEGGNIESIYFENITTGKRTASLIATTTLSETWKSFQVNLVNLDHEIDPVNEKLVIVGKAYIDNIRLTEVTDRHYLIEESWQDNCEYEDADVGKQKWTDPGHYAGCAAYTDRSSQTHNLYQFNHLCTDEAVGCELLIDTHNSTEAGTSTYPDFEVPADSYVFAVYDQKKACPIQDKGCERMGLEYAYSYPDMETPYRQYTDVYRKNDPDKYMESLCSTKEAGCETWSSRNGTSYFKDPKDMLCEWRTDQNDGFGAYNWFKKQVNRCDSGIGDGKINTATSSYGILPVKEERTICEESSECGLVDTKKVAGVPDWCEDDDDCPGSVCVDNTCRYECVTDTNDYACELDNASTTAPKTIGFGGISSKIQQPLGALEGEPWAAACPGNQDDCEEYIDPVSSFSPLIDELKPYTLYVLDSGVMPNCGDATFFGLDTSTNKLSTTTIIKSLASFGASTTIATTTGASTASSTLSTTTLQINDMFFFASEKECSFNPNLSGIREALVDYQVRYTLDKTVCNGIVDLDKGCRMFNERIIDGGSGYANLTNDAGEINYLIPTAPIFGPPNNSNELLKVVPDRGCNSWLACRSFIKDNKGNDVCFDIGLCERVDSNGNCSYFTPDKENNVRKNQIYVDASSTPVAGALTKSDISNMTGYTRVAYKSDNPILKNDYYAVDDMRQVGHVAVVSNGSFERYDDDLYPVGWLSPDNVDWESDHFRVINNPVSAQLENVKYPIDGSAFLKFGVKSSVKSEPIEFASTDASYILTFYANTKNLAAGRLQVSADFIPSGEWGSLAMEASGDWRKFVHIFKPTKITGSISFSIAGGGSDGNVYIDDVKIASVLNSRKEGNKEWYTPQDCRLYPEADALSCDYFDNSGHKKAGWPGYCLEYDRYPGKTNACLMWYPVDRINGDGYEEGGGYIEREPLYYCVGKAGYDFQITNWYANPTPYTLATEDLVIKNNLGAHVSTSGVTHRNPYKFSEDFWDITELGFGDLDPKWLRWENIDHIRVRHTSPEVTCDKRLSRSWDLYYRFKFDPRNPKGGSNIRGSECPRYVSEGDCVPWGAPREGGWDYDKGFLAELNEATACTASPGGYFLGDCEDAYDKHTVYGGIEIKNTPDLQSFAGIRTTSFDSYCDHPDRKIEEVVIFPKIFYCSDIIQTVTSMGVNKYYSGNVYEGTDFKLNCNRDIGYAVTKSCEFKSDLAPFGAIAQPGLESEEWSMMSNPFMWDGVADREGKQPLFFSTVEGDDSAEVRMGQLYDQNSVLGNLFAQYYGKWHYTPNGGAGLQQVIGSYQRSGNTYFIGGGALPRIFNIETNPKNGNIYANNLVNLTFNTDVAVQQLPLTTLHVNWGDGSVTSISGVEMRDRPEAKHPHSMYHIYGSPRSATITITIRDNWGKQGSASIQRTINSAFLIN